ncbi:hypothetical protein PF010_g20029 [Phytophthora fragariae]|uniref:Uncharacterized protein n=1 Tax=Phytophthora fragariae TaxID=53985 RepID=A0A6A3M0K2_9STRA|nr:hypothetical protein PF011_g4683 [Phytophthora fragariae]KAE9086586.1 hypothetical protein PF010_g20029 [Phytophthora fragariae]KAE9202723.1 hypothetical protein PF004_g18338 [Phytophthora fragariae]
MYTRSCMLQLYCAGFAARASLRAMPQCVALHPPPATEALGECCHGARMLHATPRC